MSQSTNRSASLVHSGILWKTGTGLFGSVFKQRLFELKLTGKLDYFECTNGIQKHKGTILLSSSTKIKKHQDGDKFVIKTKDREWHLWCKQKNGKQQVDKWCSLLNNMIHRSNLPAYKPPDPQPTQFDRTLSKAAKSIKSSSILVADKSKKRLSLDGQLKQARKSLEQFINPKTGVTEIPKWVLQGAKGIVFLTVIKAGFLFAGNVGTGCIIVRNPNKIGWTRWSGPSSIGVAGISFGFLAGASKIDYIMILPNDAAVKQFTGKGQLRLGGELQLAVGPVGRSANGSVGAGDTGASVIYSYSHAKGLYGGLALDGKVISVRPECNKNFYGNAVTCADILTCKIDDNDIPFNTDYQRLTKILDSYCDAIEEKRLDDLQQHVIIDDDIEEFIPRKPHEIIPEVLVFAFIRDFMTRTKMSGFYAIWFYDNFSNEILELILEYYYFVNAVVVIDNGSGSMKIGYAGDEYPHREFASIVGKPRNIEKAEDYELIVIGDEAQEMRGVLSMRYPIQNQLISKWEDMERLWYYSFYNQLHIRPEESYVLLTESPYNSRTNRAKMAEIMFENFDVEGLYISIGETLSLFASGRTTGVVLSSGHGATNTVPVYEGYCLKHAIGRIDINGQDCTDYLMKLCASNGYVVPRIASNDIKKTLCYVALDFEEECEQNDEQICTEYVLPDGEKIKIGIERFKTPEIMFKPQFIGLSENGVHNLVFDTIMKCDIDLRTELFKNIVLAGGNTLFKGFTRRLKDEIEILISDLESMECKVNVIGENERIYSQWMGGAIFSVMSKFKDLCISRDEYDEHGPQIVHQKYP